MVDSFRILQYLTFSITGEEYAIGILEVREIVEFPELTRIPQTPDFVRGVINLRGSVVPVLDLSVKFGLPESKITKWTCIVIIETSIEEEKITIGVIADVVNQVIDLSQDEIEQTPSFGTKISSAYIVGMAKAGKKFILILDIAKILSTDEALSLSSVYVANNEELSSELVDD